MILGNKKNYIISLLTIVMVFVLSSCATTRTMPVKHVNPDDPYESYNRFVFKFNDELDQAFLTPAAKLYIKIVPKPLAKGVHNFFNNIENIQNVAEDVLQGNIYQASSDLWRMGINTTLGIGGLFDVAAPMGLEQNYEDFGLTLAQWGYTKSNYLVLPFFGPSTLRDTIGMPVDYYAFSIYPYIHPTIRRYELYALWVVDKRAQILEYQNVFEQAAFDKYAFVRSAYMQRRAYLIQRNKDLGDPYLDKDNLSGKAKTAQANISNDNIIHTNTEGVNGAAVSADTAPPQHY